MEKALQQLRAKVISGELMPGEQIRQEEMAGEFGVSRVPLREALNLLADQGLLIHRPNVGYFVAKRAPDELAQISRILQLLENELIASLEWPDAACIDALRALNGEMKVCATAADWTPLVRLNRQFHLQIYDHSRYKLILEEVTRLWTLADLFIATKMSDTAARVNTVQEHERLIDSLAQHDRGLVLATMQAHWASTASGLPLAISLARTPRPEPTSSLPVPPCPLPAPSIKSLACRAPCVTGSKSACKPRT
jgi:DNA-binding GntR family transcriptional regulator